MGYIYILTSPSGKSYIGQTTRPIKKRFRQHQHKSSRCSAIYNAIQYHGWENFEKEWYEVPDDDLNFYEEMLVALLGTLAPSGYNLREGGGSTGKLSEETKQKLSGENHHMWGGTHSDKTKLEMSRNRQGDNNNMFGKSHSEESRQKNRDAHLGEKNRVSKRVYQYDLDGTFINSFGSTREAGRYLDKSPPSISKCAGGKRKSAYGFKWSYIKF